MILLLGFKITNMILKLYIAPKLTNEHNYLLNTVAVLFIFLYDFRTLNSFFSAFSWR